MDGRINGHGVGPAGFFLFEGNPGFNLADGVQDIADAQSGVDSHNEIAGVPGSVGAGLQQLDYLGYFFRSRMGGTSFKESLPVFAHSYPTTFAWLGRRMEAGKWILLRRIILTIDKIKYAKVKVNPKKIDSHNYPPG
jgi:hypothetical protein